jgi:hypothetical protein
MIEDLLRRLDDLTPWVVRGGPGAILAWAATLRGALNRALELSREGHGPTSIRKPDDRIVIPAEQIWELWERLGMVDKRPRYIGDRLVTRGVAGLVAGAIGLGTVMQADIPHHVEAAGHVTLYTNLPTVTVTSSMNASTATST